MGKLEEIYLGTVALCLVWLGLVYHARPEPYCLCCSPHVLVFFTFINHALEVCGIVTDVRGQVWWNS